MSKNNFFLSILLVTSTSFDMLAKRFVKNTIKCVDTRTCYLVHEFFYKGLLGGHTKSTEEVILDGDELAAVRCSNLNQCHVSPELMAKILQRVNIKDPEIGILEFLGL